MAEYRPTEEIRDYIWTRNALVARAASDKIADLAVAKRHAAVRDVPDTSRGKIRG